MLIKNNRASNNEPLSEAVERRPPLYHGRKGRKQNGGGDWSTLWHFLNFKTSLRQACMCTIPMCNCRGTMTKQEHFLQEKKSKAQSISMYLQPKLTSLFLDSCLTKHFCTATHVLQSSQLPFRLIFKSPEIKPEGNVTSFKSHIYFFLIFIYTQNKHIYFCAGFI